MYSKHADANAIYYSSILVYGTPIIRYLTMRWLKHFRKNNKNLLSFRTGKLTMSPKKLISTHKRLDSTSVHCCVVLLREHFTKTEYKMGTKSTLLLTTTMVRHFVSLLTIT